VVLGFPRRCWLPCRRAAVGQAGAPAAAQRRGGTSLTPASGGRGSQARKAGRVVACRGRGVRWGAGSRGSVR